ncbi:prephenate dehydratase [Stomatohabitans albus]|uniref:prephenate dehydratase n=1 Tax=Stomatohabitans albus TaxID=3110766 RepID=UPI00300D32EF
MKTVTDGQPKPLAHLGPAGTFTELAAMRFAQPGQPLSPLPSIRAVIEAVRNGHVDAGVVPIENAVEGAVTATLDLLGFGPPGVYMQAETDVPIEMALLAFPGTVLDEITEVRSHPVALGQCTQWLDTHLDSAALIDVASTAEGATQVRDAGAHSSIAALGNALLAEQLGLEIVAAPVQDLHTNATRFALIGRSLPPLSGHDRTSIVVFLDNDRAGQLLSVLSHFASRGINLTRIVSRPTRRAFGDYAMFIDFEGHVEDNHVGNALRAVHRHVGDIRVLGSVARADGTPSPSKPQGESDADYAAARTWYDGLRNLVQ